MIKLLQCWDDGVVDDIRLIEILRRHKARASFNLNMAKHQPKRVCGGKFKETKEVWTLSLGEIREVYEGFLVANHTLTHPFLTRIPIEEATRDIREGRERLENHFGYAIRGFAYPFGDYNETVCEAVREASHLYARTVNSVDDLFPVKDPMAFHPNCHFLSPDFWKKFDHAKATGIPFYFWGHSYELVTENDWTDFETKIARLSQEGEWYDLPNLFPADQ